MRLVSLGALKKVDTQMGSPGKLITHIALAVLTYSLKAALNRLSALSNPEPLPLLI